MLAMKASLGLGEWHTSGICSRSSAWSFLSEHCHQLWVVSLLLFQQPKTNVRAKKYKCRKVRLEPRDGGVTPHVVSATGAPRRPCHIDILLNCVCLPGIHSKGLLAIKPNIPYAAKITFPNFTNDHIKYLFKSDFSSFQILRS